MWPPVAFGGLQWRSVAARATHFSGRSQVRSRRFQRRSQVLPRPRHPAQMGRRDLHASYTCSRDLRSTRGTGRPTREVPSGCQPVGHSAPRDTAQEPTQERTQIGVDRLGETSARRTRALDIRDEHAALVAQLERHQGPGRWIAGRTAAAHFTRNGSDCCRNRRRPNALSASHVRSDLVRIRALYTPGAQASNHSIMEARSPFSGRFAAGEISR